MGTYPQGTEPLQAQGTLRAATYDHTHWNIRDPVRSPLVRAELYTEKEIEQAVAAVQDEVPIAYAARHFGIPRSTLRHRLAGRLPIRQAQELYQRVAPEQEKRLANWILLQASLGLPPTHAEVRFFAQEILRHRGDSRPLGKHWIRGFLNRYPEIRSGRGRRIESARVKGATTATIRQWWERLQIPEVAGIKPENTYNADEGGLQEGKTGNGLVLGLAEARLLQRKEPGTRTWTSFIECISATGVFLPATRPDPPQPRLLILDGHGSHITKEFMYLCLRNDVYILYLPPHTSHVLQPLDLSVFSPLKHAYRKITGSQALFTCSTVVGKRHFLQAYASARS
ncbi:hypothetical protein RB597_008897 [Gaeumannomyces tritici]